MGAHQQHTQDTPVPPHLLHPTLPRGVDGVSRVTKICSWRGAMSFSLEGGGRCCSHVRVPKVHSRVLAGTDPPEGLRPQPGWLDAGWSLWWWYMDVWGVWRRMGTRWFESSTLGEVHGWEIGMGETFGQVECA